MKGNKPLIINGPAFPLDEAVSILTAGGVIAYPTETFYGLGADPFNIEAVKKIFALKGRSETSPISVIIKDIEMLSMVASDPSPLSLRLIERFWPGPLTIIFRASPGVPELLTANTGRIAVRISSNPLATRLSGEFGGPITSTSANPSGKNPAVTPSEVLGYFNGSIDALIDGGALEGRFGSTIVDATGQELKLLREGDIPFSAIKEAL